MSKYKVGDKVRIKKGLTAGVNKRGDNYVAPEMCTEYAGKSATITKVFPTGDYRLDVDDGRWTWWNRCLKPLFSWKRFRKGKVSVYLPTEEAAKDFMRRAEAKGYRWWSGHLPTEWGAPWRTTVRCHEHYPDKRFKYSASPTKSAYTWEG